LSDRGPTGQVFEDRLDDIRCVMDEVGSERASLFGCHLGGRLALLFGATYPERTTAIVTFGAHPATLKAEPDYPWGSDPVEYEYLLTEIRGGLTEQIGPRFVTMISPGHDRQTYLWWMALVRSASSSAETYAEVSSLAPVDIRPVLPSVHVPVLVMHRAGDRATNPNASRYMAERIPGARYVELPGEEHLPFLGDAETVLDLTEEFLTGTRPIHEPDRVLATILFTDIVDSTRRASELGDERWRAVLAAHDRGIREALDRHRGREVKTTGDGFLATFDGPARGIRCAFEIRDTVREHGLEVRIGLHTGECELLENDLGGIAVHIGARVMAHAGTGQVLCSRTVRDLVIGGGFSFEDRGLFDLKGVPDPWQLYAVEPGSR
jgi:class 3 adenylate cyclase